MRPDQMPRQEWVDPLDKLKPKVRGAAAAVSRWMGDDKDWATIRTELVRLARDNEALRSKCNVIMSGSTQHLGRAERAESANRDCVTHFEQMQAERDQALAELAALKRRIAESPVVECPPDKPTTEDGWLQVIEWAKGVNWTKGRRVRLLLDDGEGA